MRSREGLRLARLVMVMSSFSPLFVLWAIRGTILIPDRFFVSGCILLAVSPICFYLFRVYVAKAEDDRLELVTGPTKDERSHLLGYVFAILLPLYQDALDNIRGLIAVVVALGLVIALFWRLNLHYMNVLFLLFNYRIYSVSAPSDGNQYSGKGGFVLITRRTRLGSEERIQAYRISDSMYLEVQP